MIIIISSKKELTLSDLSDIEKKLEANMDIDEKEKRLYEESIKQYKKAIQDHKDDLEQIKSFFEENQYLFDKLKEWPGILGLSKDEVGRMTPGQIIPLLKRKLGIKEITYSKDIENLVSIITRYPNSYITPIDKVSRKLLTGELEGAKMHQIAMEKRGSKKEITTMTSINFDELNSAVQFRGSREITPYDREVHDAIVTLNVEGSNDYITPQMIYQVMTGDPKAYLNPKQAEAISNSITKCMYSRVTINSDAEAKAYGYDTVKYDGNLIQAERVTATLNGSVIECLHILRPPILYEYANNKNQIGRVNIKLLNSPINKTEEVITMQGYLSRRIISMKGSSLSKTIVYDTVYKYIRAGASSDGALRKKKAKVRGQIKDILDYWKKEEFILSYVENKRGTEIYSVTIRI